MFRRVACFAFLIVVCTTVGRVWAVGATAQGDARAQAETAVRAALESYLQLFSSRQTEAIADRIYFAPSINTTATSVAVALTAADVRKRFESTLATLVPQGYEKSVMPHANVCVLSDVAAVVSARFIRYRRDGSVLSELGSTYVFVKTDHGWRIATQLAHDADRILACAK